MIDNLPLWSLILIFLVAALLIAVSGTKMAGLADQLADRTGLGEAMTGTIALGLITALPGISASITAALQGYPALAISNAMGGIAIQTAFLAVADISYRKANLEHAAASLTNMIQTAVLILLMTLVVLGLGSPEVTIAHVHPITPLLLVSAGFGLVLSYRSRDQPMWQPRQTPETVPDRPEPGSHRHSLSKLIFGLVITGILVLASGVVVAHTAAAFSDATGISQSIAGGIFTAAATSLPELVTTVAAVRRGALTLAVSDIVGGNLFDVLFCCFADFAYFQGSLYHAENVGHREVFLTALTIVMNALLLMGLLYRQKRGVANIGFESILLAGVYVCGMIILTSM